jgi:hypothetical protein
MNAVHSSSPSLLLSVSSIFNLVEPFLFISCLVLLQDDDWEFDPVTALWSKVAFPSRVPRGRTEVLVRLRRPLTHHSIVTQPSTSLPHPPYAFTP